jgi:Fe-S-cluster containining protein
VGRGLSRGELHRELAKVYAQVPAVDCRGACWDTCTRFPVSRLENRRLWRETGREIEPPGMPPHPPCPLLTNLGQCSAYAIRPLICRVWGSSVLFPCNYGCVPAGGLLGIQDTYRLFAQVYDLSGEQEMAEVCAEIAAKPDAELAPLLPSLKAMAWGKIDYGEALRRTGRAR